MRVSPIGFAYDRIDEVFREAERSESSTHDQHNGTKEEQAVKS